jgi:hypothetical protein
MRITSPLAFLLFVASASAQITTFDVPDGINARPSAISSSGEIVGSYLDTKVGRVRGFLRNKNGSITPFDFPNAEATFPTGVNSGLIVGVADVPNATGQLEEHSFHRSDAGVFTAIGPASAGFKLVVPYAINPTGQIVGGYGTEGFLQNQNGVFTVIDIVPGGGFPTAPVTAINQAGECAGYSSVLVGFEDILESTAFLRQPDGNITTFTVLNARSTMPSAINARGQIAGTWNDDLGQIHGFVREVDGKIVTTDVPNAIVTSVEGIDSRGRIAGFYQFANGVGHGYVRETDGTTITIDVPGAAETPGFTGTFVTASNPGGEITGYFIDSNGNLHGWVKTH